ncbi:MAG: type II secretion system protein [Verrucomicrobiota bacterium]
MPPPANTPRHPRAFTLVELLSVIAIIGVLAAILIPVTASVRASGKQAACASNLRQLHMGTMLYSQDNKNLLPALYHGTPWYTVLKDNYLSDPRAFFCPAAEHDPAFSANYIPYGYNFHISGGVGVAPSVNRNQLLYPQSMILIADSIDTANQQYYIQRNGASIRAGARHKGKIQLVHVDGSIALAEPDDLLDNRHWLPLR